jgi:hypothetical protein
LQSSQSTSWLCTHITSYPIYIAWLPQHLVDHLQIHD